LQHRRCRRRRAEGCRNRRHQDSRHPLRRRSFHLWQWNLRSGKSTGEAEIDLLKYPVRVSGKDVEVDFSQILDYD
jgi:hypothetical protein